MHACICIPAYIFKENLKNIERIKYEITYEAVGEKAVGETEGKK